jgi:hypothetical protein
MSKLLSVKENKYYSRHLSQEFKMEDVDVNKSMENRAHHTCKK